MALATSETSARVGRGLSVMLSNIWVAMMVGLACLLQCVTISFWMRGILDRGNSMPRSPRATMITSAAATMEWILSTASRSSILATTGGSAPCRWSSRWTFCTASASRMKLTAT